jgi:peptidoglycan-associated lipoprotein
MINASRIAGLTVAVISVAVLDACHKKPEPAPEPTVRTGTPTTTTTVSGPNADSIRRAEEEANRRRAEEAARRRADSIAAAEAYAREARAALTAAVHFDFDQSDLRSEDRTILDAKVPILQSNTGVMLTIQGHTDERGSDEYNLALGQRRAATVKRYLVDHGIADSRLQTITYGEERPVAQGSDESAWAQNRRAEFEITAGGQNLRRP